MLHALFSYKLEQQGKEKVKYRHGDNADLRIRQAQFLNHRGNGGNDCKGTSEKGRDHTFIDELIDQRSDTGTEHRNRYVKPAKDRNQNDAAHAKRIL